MIKMQTYSSDIFNKLKLTEAKKEFFLEGPRRLTKTNETNGNRLLNISKDRLKS